LQRFDELALGFPRQVGDDHAFQPNHLATQLRGNPHRELEVRQELAVIPPKVLVVRLVVLLHRKGRRVLRRRGRRRRRLLLYLLLLPVVRATFAERHEPLRGEDANPTHVPGARIFSVVRVPVLPWIVGETRKEQRKK